MLNDELTLALDRISEMDEVRVVILRGAGKVFCAGADLKGRASVIKGPGDLPAHSRRTRECFHAIRECAKLVICAINGPALGSGAAIAASCDILIASEKASLGLPEVDVGLLGIVEVCTAPEDLMAAALEIDSKIAAKSPVSTRMGKHTLTVIEDMSLRDGYRYEQDMTAQIGKKPPTPGKRSSPSPKSGCPSSRDAEII